MNDSYTPRKIVLIMLLVKYLQENPGFDTNLT